MDIIALNEASTANGRIEKFINEPDSSSGIVTVPKVIASGETVTIPSGRVAVLPNVQIDGVLNVENDGEVFIPSGATLGDLDAQLSLKADTSYVNTQLVLKQNILVANDAGVKTALNATGAAPIYACRAWVNFKGTGTVAIRASGNVSSITDNGVGDYTVNFTTAMQDANYALTGLAAVSGSTGTVIDGSNAFTRTTSSFRIFTTNGGELANADGEYVNVLVIR